MNDVSIFNYKLNDVITGVSIIICPAFGICHVILFVDWTDSSEPVINVTILI
jgi:hypothetical protein